MHAYTQELDDSMDDLESSCEVLEYLLQACRSGNEEIDAHTVATKAEVTCRRLRKAFQKFTFNWDDVRDETEERKGRFTNLIERAIFLYDQLMSYADSKPLRDHYESATGRNAMIDALVNGRTEEFRTLLRKRILTAAAASQADNDGE